jgi:hypothetical protein
MMLVVKTMLYNIGGVGERHHCLINLLGFVKYSWNLESIVDFTDYMHLLVNILLTLGKNPYDLMLQRFLLKKNRVAGLHFSEYYDFVPSPYPGFEIEHLVDPGLIFSVPKDEDEDKTGGQGVVLPQPLPSTNGDAAKVGAAQVKVAAGVLVPNLDSSRDTPYPQTR